MRAYDPNRALISLHIPKCGGQSLREVLAGWFQERFFIHYFQQRRALPPRHELEPGVCIHGHFNRTRGFGALDYYPKADQFIAVLRHPLEAAVSNYFHWKTKARAKQLATGALREGDAHDYSDINDFFRKRPKTNLLDFLPWELSAGDFRDLMDAHFVWIGSTETLQADVDVLARLLGFPPAVIGRINASPRDENLDPELRRAFLRENALEIEIYHYVMENRERLDIRRG
jgi:hypothetical protein